MKTDDKFNAKMEKLFAQIATGNYTVMVNANNGRSYEAIVTGYSKTCMTIDVEFVSDNLTVEKNVDVPYDGFGVYDQGFETLYRTEKRNVPVKRMTVYYDSIEF